MSTAYNKPFYFSIPDNLYVAKAPKVSGACCDGVTAADAYAALDDIIDLCADSCRQNRIPLQKPLKKLESTSPSVLEVASHIVKSRKSVTLLQLQGLYYYCKVWSLIWFDTPLFREEFQTWADGPVNADLFHKLREYRTVRPEELQFPHAFSDSEKRFINCILTAYGCEFGEELSATTRCEDAWNIARGDIPEETPSTSVITDEMIRRSYTVRSEEEGNQKPAISGQ